MNLFLLILGIFIPFVFIGLKLFTKIGNKKSTIFVTVISACLILLSGTVFIIPTGYVGIKTTFGQISENKLSNGIQFTIPFVQKIKQVNCKQQDESFNNLKVSAETTKRTEVFYSGIVITYQIGKEKAVWLYTNVSDVDDLITAPIISSSLKVISKTLEDEQSTNRATIEPLLKEQLQKSLNEKYGKNTVIIIKTVVQSATFSKAYNKAVEDKQQAQLAYEKQQIENKKAIEKAEADANAKAKTAEGDANAAKIRAEGEAEANRKIASSLSEKVLRQNTINMLKEKWDGQLSKVTGGENGLFDFSSLLEDKKQ